jgi:hypothetical protein
LFDPQPLKPRLEPVDNPAMPGKNENERSDGPPQMEDDLSFAAFALAHSPCGEVIEVRIDQGSVVQWCVACADARLFGPFDP